MDDRIDIIFDFDDVALDNAEWFDHIFENMEVYSRIELFFLNRLKRAKLNGNKKEQYELEQILNMFEYCKTRPQIASNRYIDELKDKYDKLIDLKKRYNELVEKASNDLFLYMKKEDYYKKIYYENASIGINYYLEKLKELIDLHYQMKDMILEEMYPEFVGKVPYEEIYKLEYVKPDFINFVKYLLSGVDPRVEHVYCESHCNVKDESDFKAHLIHQLFGNQVPFIDPLFHNREIDTYNEGSYVDGKPDGDLTATSKYRYARSYINSGSLAKKNPRNKSREELIDLKKRKFKDNATVLIDNSLSVCAEFEKNGGYALVYCNRPIDDQFIQKLEKEGFRPEDVITSFMDYEEVMEKIMNRISYCKSRRNFR